MRQYVGTAAVSLSRKQTTHKGKRKEARLLLPRDGIGNAAFGKINVGTKGRIVYDFETLIMDHSGDMTGIARWEQPSTMWGNSGMKDIIRSNVAHSIDSVKAMSVESVRVSGPRSGDKAHNT